MYQYTKIAFPTKNASNEFLHTLKIMDRLKLSLFDVTCSEMNVDNNLRTIRANRTSAALFSLITPPWEIIRQDSRVKFFRRKKRTSSSPRTRDNTKRTSCPLLLHKERIAPTCRPPPNKHPTSVSFFPRLPALSLHFRSALQRPQLSPCFWRPS